MAKTAAKKPERPSFDVWAQNVDNNICMVMETEHNEVTAPYAEMYQQGLSAWEAAKQACGADNIQLHYLKGTAISDQKFAKEELDKWADTFKDNPVSALEWAADTFNQAARYEASTKILAWMELGKNNGLLPADLLRDIKKEVLSATMRGAKWPSRSTSVPHNEMKLCMTARWAEWLEKLEDK